MEQELHVFAEPEAGFSYQNEIIKDEIFFESTRDYVLPDYQPEIRKLFSVTTAIDSSGKYENSGRAECSGSLFHTLLYSDAESKLQSVTLSSDYDYAYDGGEEGESALLFGSERILSVACRLSGPRRLSIRAKMAARLHMIGETRVTCVPVGAGMEETAVLKKPISAMHTERRESELLLSESVSLPIGSPENARLLREVCSVAFRDTRIREDGVLLRGDVICKMLLAEGDGMPFSETVKLPFEETLYAPGVSSDAGIEAAYEIRQTEIHMEAAANGVTANCEVSLLLFMTLRENKTALVPTDLYFVRNEAILTRKPHRIPKHMGTTCSRFSVGGEFPSGEGEAQGALGVVDTAGRVILSGVESVGGSVYFTGECRVRFLLSGAPDEEGCPRLFSAEYSTPFRYEVPMHEIGDDCVHEAALSLQSLTGRLDGERLSFSAEIGYTLVSYAYSELSLLTAAEAGAELSSEDVSYVTVLYPGEGESLWSLGKQSHRMPEDIARENGLPVPEPEKSDMPESLSGAVRIFLPE